MRLLLAGLVVCVGLTGADATAQNVPVRGVATVIEIDHDDGRPPERRVTLRDRAGVTGPPGRVLELRAKPMPSHGVARAFDESAREWIGRDVVSGQIVEVRGSAAGGKLTLEKSSAESVQVLSAPAVSAVSMALAGQMIVIMGDFQDKVLDCGLPEVDGIVFSDADSMGNLIEEASFGDLVLGGVTVGPYTIPFNSTSFSYESWDDALRDAATQDGVDLSPYAHHIYVLPANSLSSSGMGTVGVDLVDMVTKSWIFNCDRPGAYAHEFGHNLTLGHASRYLDDTGSVQSLGDQSDNMGSQIDLRHYNGPHKLRLGWVPETKVREVTKDGIYTLRRLWDSGTGRQLLRIRNVDPTIAPFYDTDFYYVSYRPPLGFDVNLPAGMQDGVFVHETSVNAVTTYLREWLDVGEVFSEPVESLSKVSVRVIAKDGVTATVEVLGVSPPVPSMSFRGLAGLAGLLLATAAWRRRVRRA